MSKNKKRDAAMERLFQLEILEMSQPTTEEAIVQFKKMRNAKIHHSVQYPCHPDIPSGEN